MRLFAHAASRALSVLAIGLAGIGVRSAHAGAPTEFPPFGRKIYTGKAETIHQYREAACLDNVALLSKGATAWVNSVLNEGTRHAYPAERAIDGDENTGWVGEEREQHTGPYAIEITLSEPHTIGATYWMRSLSEQPRDRAPERYRIKVSPDGTNWQTVVQVEGYGYCNRYDTFAPVRARRVRMEIDKVQVKSGHGPELKEFKVFVPRAGVDPDGPGWWNRDWHFRTRLPVPGGQGAATARIPVNFTRMTECVSEAFLPESIRVVGPRADAVSASREGTGGDDKDGTPFLFIRSGDFDAQANASGTLLFVPDDHAAGEYYGYFDMGTPGGKPEPEFRLAGVTSTPAFTAEGWNTRLRVEPGDIETVTVLNDRDEEVQALSAQGQGAEADVALGFDHHYYARVARTDQSVAHLWLTRPASRALPPDLQAVRLPRTVFARNESIVAGIVLTNAGADRVAARLSVCIKDPSGRVWYREKARAGLAPGQVSQTDTVFAGVNLTPGDYVVSMTARGADDLFLMPPKDTAIRIVENKPIQFLYGSFGPGRVTRGQPDWIPTLEAMAAAGINAAIGNDIPTMDDYLAHGLQAIGKIGFQLPFRINEHPEKYAAVDQNGDYVLPPYQGTTWYPNYTHPEVQEGARKAFQEYLAPIKDHPGFSGYVFSNDDYQLPSPKQDGVYRICGYSETDRALFKKLTGFEPPRPGEVEVKKGIIPDDDLWSTFVRFRCTEIFANGNNKLRVDAKNEVAPRVKFGQVHGPMQDNFYAPIAGLYPPSDQAVCDFVGGYSYLNQWREWKRYTTYGDLCRMGERNRRRGRELIMLPPLGACTMGFTKVEEGVYRRQGDHLSSDWAFRNQVYQLLAGGFNGLWFYVWDHAGRNPTHKPELLAEVTTIGGLLKRYGPFLKSLHTSDKPVGVLVSITDSAYGSFFLPASKHGTHNGCWFPDRLLRAHIPAETFCEEEMMAGILPKYKVVVVYDVMVMKASIAARLEEYIRRGGNVLLVGSDDIPLAGAERLSLPSRNKDDGVVARLRQLISPLADTPSDEITIREFDDGHVTYLFFVDCFFDKHCYNVRGEHPEFWDGSTWKDFTLRLEAKREAVTLARPFKYAVDVFGQREVALTPTETGCTFRLDLEPGGGKLIALYPQRVGAPRFHLPKRVRAGEEFEVAASFFAEDGKRFIGNLPVAVDVVDAAGHPSAVSDYYVARGGRLKVRMRTAVNDMAGAMTTRVTELATGRAAEGRLAVR